MSLNTKKPLHLEIDPKSYFGKPLEMTMEGRRDHRMLIIWQKNKSAQKRISNKSVSLSY